MSVCGVSWLDLLYELTLQNGYALLLTAQHQPAGFAEPSRTILNHLSVVEPATATADGLQLRPRRKRIRSGDLVARVDLDTVGGDLEAAAELLVQVLTRSLQKAA